MNIVLTSVHIANTPDAIPLAPALLKTYIEKYNSDEELNTTILESTLSKDIDIFVKEILDTEPNIIGFSIYLWNRDYYLSVLKKIKELDKDIIIIAGGAEVRSDYKFLLSLGINYTIQGEGEKIFSELMTSLYNGDDSLLIDGVNDNKTKFIPDLDTIPSPLLNNNIDLKKYDGYLWELSRGCPYSCDFCFESRGAKGVRYYGMDRIEKELNYIIENRTDQVFVLDPTFNKDLKRAKQILKLIKKKNRGTHFHFEVRAELLDKEISDLFEQIGASLQIGIQSSHDHVLKLINRRIDKELFSKKIDLLNSSGTVFGLDLIYGLPGDNYQGFKKSMEYVLSLQPNHIDIFPLSVLPGTALWDNSEQLKLNFQHIPPYTVLNSPTFSSIEMEKAFKLKESCDFIYNKGRSTGWLKQICNELKIEMTDFIENFSTWNSTKKHSDSLSEPDIIKLYIQDKYNPKFFNLIKDIIGYHSAYSAALLSEKKCTKIDKKTLLESIPTLSPTATLQIFSYPVLDAIDNGYYTLSEIKQSFKPETSSVISWFHNGGDVIFDSYTKEIMSFLSKINGRKSCIEISKKIDLDFLFFAQQSGLILFN